LLDVNGTGRFSGEVTATKLIVGQAIGLSGNLEVYSASYGTLAAFRSIPNDGINSYLLITSSANGITFEENGSSYKDLMFKTGATTRLTIASTGAATFSGQIIANANNGAISVSGTGYSINPTNMLIGRYTSTRGYIQVPTNGTFEIWDGGTSTIAIFNETGKTSTFYGSVTATGFFESSSIKGKNIIATNPLLALDIDVIKYTRKNDESKDIRYGYSAEQIHSLMPELTDKDVTAVKYLDVHTILISQLQQEIKELKAKMN
jgi:hypothetical protein